MLPFPRGISPDAMVWQQAAGMSFAMPGGYFIGPRADRRAHVGGQPSKTGELFTDVMIDAQLRRVTPAMRRDFVADLHRWKACTVVLSPAELRRLARAGHQPHRHAARISGRGVAVARPLQRAGHMKTQQAVPLPRCAASL